MNIAEREQQILRVKATSFQPELDEALEQGNRIKFQQRGNRGFRLYSNTSQN